MPLIALEVPEELSEQLKQIGDRLPELLALSLQQPALPAHIYRYMYLIQHLKFPALTMTLA